MSNIYKIRMDKSYPETYSFPLTLTDEQIAKLRKQVNGNQTDTVQDLVIKLLKKI
jgi:hypothetical protein